MTIRSRAKITVAALWTCAAILTQEATGAGNVTTIRYAVTEAFTATGVDPDAAGSVQAFVKRECNTSRQRLRVAVAQLDPRANYTLLTQMGDDPNFVPVANFTTTPTGSGGVLYIENAPNDRVTRRATKHSLPAVVSDVTHAGAIAVANANGEIVLSASLHESPSMNFEMAAILENTGEDLQAVGCIAVACQNGGVQFRLFATGQSSEFTFCVNEIPVAVYPTDETGRISIGVFPVSAPSPTMFQKLSLRNAANEVVLETVVP